MLYVSLQFPPFFDASLTPSSGAVHWPVSVVMNILASYTAYTFISALY